MAYNLFKSPEIFTDNGSTSLTAAVVNSKTLTLNSLPPGLNATNATTYKVWIGPAATAASYPLASANLTTKAITVTSTVNLNLAINSIIWVGKASTPVAAGMAQFYVRAGVIVPQGALVRFGDSHENFSSSNPATLSSNLIKLTAAVSSTSTAIGKLYSLIGGIPGTTSDTIAFTETISKNVNPNRGVSQTITFAESIAANRIITKATADAVTLADSVVVRSTLTIAVSESLVLGSSSSGHANVQNIYTADTLTLADTLNINKQIIANISESVTFSDQAICPKRSFTTPLTKVVPPILPETRGQAYLLFRHYAPTYRHVNVFQLSNGTYVQDYPTVENGNANVPYPWITDSPDNRYAFVTYWNGTTQAFTLDPHIKQVFWGGEVSFIDQDTANQMIREHPLYANYMDTTNA